MTHPFKDQARRSFAEQIKRHAPHHKPEYPPDRAARLATADQKNDPIELTHRDSADPTRRIKELEAAAPYRNSEPVYEAPLISPQEKEQRR